MAALRSRIDEAAWEAAWAEGRRMSFEKAVENTRPIDEKTPRTRVHRGVTPIRTAAVISKRASASDCANKS